MSILSSNNLILKYFKGTDPEEKRMFTEHHRMVFETISTATPFESALLAYFSKRTTMY